MRVWKCPRCSVEINPGATVCPGCKIDVALCGFCFDVTSLERVVPHGWWRRQRYLCDRCGRKGAKCQTSLVGGYCSSLARAEGRLARPVCAECSRWLVDAGKQVVAWTLIGLLGSHLRRPRG